jgi:hypothetical protein
MGTFLEVCGFGLVVAFVWVVCGQWWGILALGVVLIVVGNAIDRGAPNGTASQPDGEPQQRE